VSPPPDPELLSLQEACAGRFAIERELGRGGMGVVVQARDVALDRVVAIKLLPSALARQAEPRARFLREARIAAGFSHPNIVPIHSVEEHDDVVFFVMGYVEGETLTRRVTRGGAMPAAEATRLLQEVAWALAYAHGAGVVHRDIKPDNILLDRVSGRAVVTDFGIARVADATRALTVDGHVMGTAQFMSPEQASGEPLDGRSDLYALGVVGYFALTGTLPFEAPTLTALLAMQVTQPAPPVASRRPGLPPRLAQAVDRCLAKRPEERFATASELAGALGEAGAQGPAIAPQVRNFQRMAEQSSLILFMLAVFSLPLASRGGVRELDGIGSFVGALTAVGIDLARRARQLLRGGFTAGDVRAAFDAEAAAREDEIQALYLRWDERRNRRLKAWLYSGAAVAFALGLGALLFSKQLPRGSIERTATRAAGFVLLLAAVVTFTMAANSSPRAERQSFAMFTRVWRSGFTDWFFRVAGVGVRPDASAPSTARAEPAVPDSVRRKVPELPALLDRLEAALGALRDRESRLEHALAEAGRGEAAPVRTWSADGDGAPDDGEPGVTTRGVLLQRRVALVADLREALGAARAQRSDLSAARENLRLQIVRLRAGVGDAADLEQDLSAARALVASADA
jgi:serine/threonine-protein kinase